MKIIGLKPIQEKSLLIIFLSLAIFFTPVSVKAQNKQSLTGKIIEQQSNLPVPFANVVLLSEPDTGIAYNNGTMSDDNGDFRITHVKPGKYRLLVSSVGYTTASANIEISDLENTDAGILTLKDSTFLLEEANVVAQRIKGKSESDKTVFFVNKKMLDVSGNGTDVLKYIPGIQVDLKQNISLDGSNNILIYVDGIERDKNFVSQLNPAQIDKVETINAPPSGYDSSVTGVINIILKKEKNTGISGHIFAEIPTSNSEIFVFPSMSVSYGFKKLNLFISYNGEINYENIDECVFWKKTDGSGETNISSIQDVRQKNLFHKFQYGFDYFLNEKNYLNYYGFYNPYSYEQNGNVSVEVTGAESDNWDARRIEKDKNRGIFNSLYYKHLLNKEGGEVTFDVSSFYLNSENSTSFITEDLQPGAGSYLNMQNPNQNAFSAKTDLVLPLNDRIVLNSGLKAKFQDMEDKISDGFSYTNRIYAAYTTINYQQNKTSVNAGLRFEDSETIIKNDETNSILTVLPYFTFSYKLNSKQNIKAAFNRTVKRPSVYQLNSFTSVEGPYSVTIGNPLLKPEFRTSISVEYSLQAKSGYYAVKLFYDQFDDVMNNLTIINDDGVFETQMQNLGIIRQLGGQFLATLKTGPVTFNPVIRLYGMSTSVNNQAMQAGVQNRNQLVFEPSFSSVLTLKNDLAFSAIVQYSTPKINIQDNSYCGVLYFISFDKSFKNGIKVGAMSALPLTRNFIYAASKINANDFTRLYEGRLKLSVVPLWLRFSYTFNSGAKREKINRAKEEIDQQSKKGF